MFRLHSDNVYRSDLLQSLPWLAHGFGTRLISEWPPLAGLTSVRQVHSDRVVMADDETGNLGEGDALVTRQRARFVSVRTADCLPILIVDISNRAVAAVHAGWRGTVGEIAAKTVHVMQREYGSKREDLRAAIGPGIGVCCFEVGPEVAMRFGTIFPERIDLLSRVKIDLAEANRRQLIAEGLSREHIAVSGICTYCSPDCYHSFRRDGDLSGRMISAIGIRETGP